jgi:3-methyladenine DNA glycosylase AlkD
LLESKIHEERLVAVLLLVHNFQNGNEKEVFNFYLKHTTKINNWDLVDLSSHKIIGKYLIDKKRDILYKLAKSSNLWERRISIISCFAFIDNGDFKDAIKLASILLNDDHDLIHKGVGWMLREVGKKDLKVEEKFLRKYYKKMPRTMLRYSIERFSDSKRKFYMRK